MNVKALLFGCIGLMVSMGLTAQFMVKDMAAMQAKKNAAAAQQQQQAVPSDTSLAPVDPNTTEMTDGTGQATEYDASAYENGTAGADEESTDATAVDDQSTQDYGSTPPPTGESAQDSSGGPSDATPAGTSDAANALRAGSSAIMSCAAQKGYAGCESALPYGVTLVQTTKSSFVISAPHQGTMLYASQGSKGTCHWVAGAPDRCNGW